MKRTLDTRTDSSVCILVRTSFGNHRDTGYLYWPLMEMIGILGTSYKYWPLLAMAETMDTFIDL